MADSDFFTPTVAVNAEKLLFLRNLINLANANLIAWNIGPAKPGLLNAAKFEVDLKMSRIAELANHLLESATDIPEPSADSASIENAQNLADAYRQAHKASVEAVALFKAIQQVLRSKHFNNANIDHLANIGSVFMTGNALRFDERMLQAIATPQQEKSNG